MIFGSDVARCNVEPLVHWASGGALSARCEWKQRTVSVKNAKIHQLHDEQKAVDAWKRKGVVSGRISCTVSILLQGKVPDNITSFWKSIWKIWATPHPAKGFCLFPSHLETSERSLDPRRSHFLKQQQPRDQRKFTPGKIKSLRACKRITEGNTSHLPFVLWHVRLDWLRMKGRQLRKWQLWTMFSTKYPTTKRLFPTSPGLVLPENNLFLVDRFVTIYRVDKDKFKSDSYKAPCTLDATHDVPCQKMDRSHSDACCLVHCLLPAMWKVLLQQWVFRVLICFASRVASSVHGGGAPKHFDLRFQTTSTVIWCDGQNETKQKHINRFHISNDGKRAACTETQKLLNQKQRTFWSARSQKFANEETRWQCKLSGKNVPARQLQKEKGTCTPWIKRNL